MALSKLTKIKGSTSEVTATGSTTPRTLADRFGETGITKDSVQNLSGLVGDYDGQQISLLGWHPDSDIGGGVLYWDSTKAKADHNGGTVFSPTVPWSAAIGDYLDGAGETDGSGFGCWIRNQNTSGFVDFGAKADGSNDHAAISKSLEILNNIDTGDKHQQFTNVGDLTISNVTFSGNGSIIGTTTGLKPTALSLRGLPSSADRLLSLESYYDSKIQLTGSPTVNGTFSIKDLLITGSGNFILKSVSILDGCAIHGAQLECKNITSIVNRLISCGSSSVGVFSNTGGVVDSDGIDVISSSNRGLYVLYNGLIKAPTSNIYDTGNDSIFILYGGSIIVPNSIVDTSLGHGAIINYGGNIDLSFSNITNCTKTNLVAESSGTIYAFGANNTNSGDSGAATSFNGFINLASGTTGGHNNFDAYALGSGYINLRDTIVDGTSNGGGDNKMLRAIGNGIIFAEEPVTGSGKSALVAANYDPGYNTVGYGLAYIGKYSNNNAIVNTPVNSLNASIAVQISGGAITVSSSYHEVDTESFSASDDLNTINGGETGDRLILIASSGTRTVIIKHGIGNIQNSSGADIVLDDLTDCVELIKRSNGNWLVIK